VRNGLQRTIVARERAARGAALFDGFDAADAELELIVDRWPTSPADALEAILAMVQTADGTR
jgi:hypothetical protein